MASPTMAEKPFSSASSVAERNSSLPRTASPDSRRSPTQARSRRSRTENSGGCAGHGRRRNARQPGPAVRLARPGSRAQASPSGGWPYLYTQGVQRKAPVVGIDLPPVQAFRAATRPRPRTCVRATTSRRREQDRPRRAGVHDFGGLVDLTDVQQHAGEHGLPNGEARVGGPLAYHVHDFGHTTLHNPGGQQCGAYQRTRSGSFASSPRARASVAAASTSSPVPTTWMYPQR